MQNNFNHSEFSLSDIEKLSKLLMSIQIEKTNEIQKSLTLFGYKKEYIDWAQDNFSTNYCDSISLCFKYLIKFFGEDKVLIDISTKEAENLKSYLYQTAPRGASVYIRTIKSIFNKAVIWDYIKSSPFKNISTKKFQTKLDAIFNDNDINRMIQKTDNKILKNIIEFAYYTGCRRNEILNLTWENIDLVNRTITIGQNLTTKTKQTRIIPMCERIFNLLKSIIRKKSGNIVFCKSNGFKYDGSYISKKIKLLIRSLDLSEDLHFHSLRHSFASNLIKKGVDLYRVKELLGHTSIKTTERYAHIQLSSLRKAMEVLDST